MTVDSEPTIPFPPRFWWLKRIVVIAVLFVLGMIALLKWWAWKAEQRMTAEVARLRASGERVPIEDFQHPAVADADNAAMSLKTAAALTKQNAVAGKSVPSRAPARLARFQSKADWGVTIQSPVSTVLLPGLSSQRQLTNELAINVAYEHAVQHDAEAIEILRDMLSQANRLHQDSPFLVSDLVGIGITRKTCETIRAIAHDLEVLKDEKATTQPTGLASRQQVRMLIDDLLDDRAYRAGFQRAMQGERLFQYDTAMNASGFPAMGLPNVGPWRPMYVLDAIRGMRHITQVQAAGAVADFQTSKARMPSQFKFMPGQSAASFITHFFSSLTTPALDRVVQLQFTGLAERRVAALRLAIRLYQIDHDNQYPSRLEELVPRYIASLPADPFRAGGGTFRYVRSPTTKPVLYSVGLNGIDDGANFSLPSNLSSKPNQGTPGESDDRYAEQRADWIFPLGKPPPPATEPTDGG
jgi:hypothetical protein